MVAVNPRLLLAISLASLTLTPADAAAIRAQSSDAASPSKPVRQEAPVLPMPIQMRKAAKDKGKGKAKEEHEDKSESRKGKHHKSRNVVLDVQPLGAIVLPFPSALKRQQDQARFAVGGSHNNHIDRRHHDEDHDHDHDHGHDHDHDHKREPEPKSSVLISNHAGSSYVVSHNRRLQHRTVAVKERAEQQGVPGHVNIESPDSNSNTTTTIGHLNLNTTTAPYVLDASQDNMTTLYMVLPPTSDDSESNHCTLQKPFFDPDSAELISYCATFDPSPPQPEPLTMTRCFDASNGTTPHVSQTFLYDRDSGVIQPMWFNGEDDGMTNTTSAGTVNDEEIDGGTVNQRDSTTGGGQDVTLVFVPDAEMASTADDQQDASPESTSSSLGTAAETATVTTTVTATASVTASSAAADVGDASTTMNLSQPASASTDPALPSTASSDVPDSSSSLGVFDVEIATPTDSSADPTLSSAAPTDSSTGTIVSSDSSAPSPTASSSIDAAAVAADVAASSVPVESNSPSSTTDSAATSASEVGVGARAPEMTPVSTEPYQWMFRAEPRW
ncbi:hypothetical protein B0H10DRAFT_2228854 [Mycena sp. CBHHK59/15]|nr:hypothetical protein B0H10DRAFT_2228854 [Mycena sp. CBHHK59/15]